MSERLATRAAVLEAVQNLLGEAVELALELELDSGEPSPDVKPLDLAAVDRGLAAALSSKALYELGHKLSDVSDALLDAAGDLEDIEAAEKPFGQGPRGQA